MYSNPTNDRVKEKYDEMQKDFLQNQKKNYASPYPFSAKSLFKDENYVGNENDLTHKNYGFEKINSAKTKNATAKQTGKGKKDIDLSSNLKDNFGIDNMQGKGLISSGLHLGGDIASFFGGKKAKPKAKAKGKGLISNVLHTGGDIASFFGGAGEGVSRNKVIEEAQLKNGVHKTGGKPQAKGKGLISNVLHTGGDIASFFGGKKEKPKAKGKGLISNVLHTGGDIASFFGGKKAKGGKLIEKAQMQGTTGMTGGSSWQNLIKETKQKHPELKGLREIIGYIKAHNLYEK